MRANGLDESFAETVFNQIRGFGEYGFPESHAASFALLVYASCWIKHHHPEVFCCAMLNSQPLGFYTPAQLIADAQRHGVQIAPVDLNASDFECTLEPDANGFRVRLGLCMIRGLHENDGLAIAAQRRAQGAFRDQSQLVQRCRLGQAVLAILADSGAMASLSGNRRAAYWQALGQDKSYNSLPLLEAAGVDVDDPIPESLVAMDPAQEVAADYATTGLSLRGHPMQFHREKLRGHRVRSAAELSDLKHGQLVRVAGLIVLRQRPGTAKGITFVTMEDETGSINLVVRPKTWESHYLVCKQSNAWLVHGTLESRQGVIHVLVSLIEDLSKSIGPLEIPSRDFR
jgi:error-prone DNA polymerase